MNRNPIKRAGAVRQKIHDILERLKKIVSGIVDVDIPVWELLMTCAPAPPDQRPLMRPLPAGQRGWSSLNPAFSSRCAYKSQLASSVALLPKIPAVAKRIQVWPHLAGVREARGHPSAPSGFLPEIAIVAGSFLISTCPCLIL
jgi:hypothetical protein